MGKFNEYLATITPEMRADMREKGAIAREAKKLAGESLKQDYVDYPHWRELASKAGLRLPMSYLPASETKYIKRTLKKINRDTSWYTDVTGFKSYAEFAEHNHTWNAAALVGLLLEAHFEQTGETP